MPVDGAIVGEIVVLGELPRGAPVEEFFFDGFAFGMVADDAFAAVPFEEEHLKLLLQPPLTVDSMGFPLGLLEGVLSGGFRGRFRGHFELSLFWIRVPQDAGACVVRWEIARFSLAGFR